MNAVEFVKKFGWEEAKEVVDGLPEKFKFKPLGAVCWCNNSYKYSDRFKPRRSLVNMANLKRLVESWELVEKYGGLENAKQDEQMANDLGFGHNGLKQAIIDMESCL